MTGTKQPTTHPNRQIATVALLVPDYDEGIEFYVGKLGFELLEDTAMGPDKRWVVVSPTGSGASLLIARAATESQRAAIGNQTGGRVGFFLETDDFHRDHAAMLAAGVQFEESPRDEPYGWVAVFRDPFGNRWDMIERKG